MSGGFSNRVEVMMGETLLASKISKPKTIAAITIGNGLEFYDFVIYSFFAIMVMVTELLPQSVRATGLSIAYCIAIAIFGGFA